MKEFRQVFITIGLLLLPGISWTDTFSVDQTIFDLPQSQSTYRVIDLRVGQKALMEFGDLCTQDGSLFVHPAAEIVSDAKREDRIELTMGIDGALARVVPQETAPPAQSLNSSQAIDFSDIPYSSEKLAEIFLLQIAKKGQLWNCREFARIFPLLDNETWLGSLVKIISVNGKRSVSSLISEMR